MSGRAVIIRNFWDLATGRRRADCLHILEAGLAAADPARIIPGFVDAGGVSAGGQRVDFGRYSAVYTVAFGKAADSMTRAFNAAHPVAGGIIVIPRGSRSVIRGRKFRIFNAGHPVPDHASVRAAREALKFVRNRRDGELVVFLVSGGGSALLAMPDGITLDEKVHATGVLLRSGATIREFNCVRRHLSQVKGGRLGAALACDGVGLVMSDVEGNDPADVASGPTAADTSTPADALAVIEGHGLEGRMPASVMRALRGGSDARAACRVANHVIATNADCISAMGSEARGRGYETDSMQVYGDIRDAAEAVLARAPESPGRCLIFGGETTVRVLGRGTGGRNQELVMRLLKNMQGMPRMVIASVGTDGIDGNSPFAGAVTENTGADAAEIRERIRNSDSAGFMRGRGAAVMTGHTHTNLLDIGMVLR